MLTHKDLPKLPSLRFREFSGEWEYKMLKQIAKVGTGKRDTKNKVENGKYPFYVRSDNVERINSFAYDGEAILTSGDGAGVGKNFHYVTGKFDFHQRVYAIRDFENNANGKFIYYYFADRFYKRVMRLSAKNSVDSIRMDMISDMMIPFPSNDEQEKIAQFFTKIDDKILLLKTKIDLYSSYKKGVVQKIFSQRTRFKDDEGRSYPDWETKRLEDIFERITTKNVENNLNVLTISAQKGLVNQTDYFNKLVAAKNVTNYYLLQKGDFAYNKSYSSGYPMGAIKRLNLYEKGVVSTLYICFRAKDKENSSFYEQVFDTGVQNFEIMKIAQEGARNHGLLNISVNDFFDIQLSVPSSLEEQRKITDLLTMLDKKINNIENKLEQTLLFKKSLLQEMYV